MENPMLKYQKDFQKYATEDDCKALHTSFYSVEVNDCCQHEMDNSFISTSYGQTVHNLRSRDCQILGTSVAPWPRRGDDLAIIYENVETFEKFWCHINQTILNWWLEQEGQS